MPYHNPLQSTVAPNATETPVLIDGGGGKPVVLEQGPAALAGLLIDPPTWLVWALTLVLGAVGVATVLGARNIEGAQEWAEVLAQAGENLTLVASMGAVTYLAVNFATFPYLADVVIGVLGGGAIGLILGDRVGRLLYRHIRADLEVSEDD